jgi:hypothetical protein
MKISKTHRILARRLNNQDILNRPEQYLEYLGPNWEEVINFWLYLDTLSVNQLKVVGKSYWDLSNEERNIAWDKARRAARVTTNFYSSAGKAAHASVYYENFVAKYATYELIAIDKLLEQGNQPVFFPMFLNP